MFPPHVNEMFTSLPPPSALLICFLSHMLCKASRRGEAVQPVPIRRQWCAELCSPSVNPAVNLCVCAHYREALAYALNLLFTVLGRSIPVYLSILSILILRPSPRLALKVWPIVSRPSPSYTRNRLMYVNERRRITIKTAVKYVQKPLLGRIGLLLCCPFQTIRSGFRVSVSVLHSFHCAQSIFLRERERKRKKGSITGQIDCD